MSIYVPDNVVESPPILTLVHYCGGTASAVFGQAQGGGVVAAADQYGFIMVVPSSGRCWDVQSDTTWTRGGGGDTDAIVQMVNHAIENYGGNPDRVYATGDSSGGMMTELLLGLYPDIFKAGSAMAGMPAFCRGDNESGNGGGYSGACAGGSVMRTPEAWGDIVREMNPGYTGHLPRAQIFHGDADDIINYANHTEAIKEWTNVHGLGTDPTTMDSGVAVGNHDANRLQWENSCGVVVVDAFQSLGGDHGPSDALFLAEYVIPFLGLDQPGLVDPEIEQCGTDGSGGASSTSGAAGTTTGGAGGSVSTSGDGGAGVGGSTAGETTGGAEGAASSAGGAATTTGGTATFGTTTMPAASTSGGSTTRGVDEGATGTDGAPPGNVGGTTESEGCGCRLAENGASGRAGEALLFAGFLLARFRRGRRSKVGPGVPPAQRRSPTSPGGCPRIPRCRAA
jgi:poly(hydroxyalkanoate) depolymerase family esterase